MRKPVKEVEPLLRKYHVYYEHNGNTHNLGFFTASNEGAAIGMAVETNRLGGDKVVSRLKATEVGDVKPSRKSPPV